VSAPPASPAEQGSPYYHAVVASGTAPITFAATGLPSGLSLSAAGVISGSPSATGTFNGTITASNGTDPDAVQLFSITIESATGPISVTTDEDILVVAPLELQLPASLEGAEASGVSVNWQQIYGPSAAINDIAIISPTVQLNAAGDYGFRVQVSNSSTSDQADVNIKVLPPVENPPGASNPPVIYPLQILFDGVAIYWDSTPNATYHLGVKHDVSLPYWNLIQADIASHGDVYTYWVDDSFEFFDSGYYTVFEEQ